MRGWAVLFTILLCIVPSVTAVDQVIINSQDWRDIYTGILYAQLVGKDVHYVAEKTQGLQLINEVIDKNKKEVLLIESENPVAIGYKSHLENAGFTVERYLSSNSYQTNLEFAQKAVQEKATNFFIIIDASLGYGAVSVAPYALLNHAFVLFADTENSDQIKELLTPGENDQKVLLYGHLDRKVKEDLQALHPEAINTGEDSLDNIEIVSRFLEQQPTKQIIFTSGEVLEKSFFNQEFPVLLIGTDLIPEQTLDFLQDSSITTAVVVGYDLFSNAKKIKDETGIKVLLKYGQGRNSELYALDVFPLPKYDLKIDITSVRYNTFNNQLEVTYRNTGNAYALVQALSHRILSDGDHVAEVGDEKPLQLNPDDTVTVLYGVDLLQFLDTEITVESTVVYGQSAASLTRLFIKKAIPVETISIDDSSQISIEKTEYNQGKKRFEIIIKNVGEKDVYVDVELLDLIIDGEKSTLGSEPQKIDPGKTTAFIIKVSLEAADFEENKDITVRARYGEREGILIKTIVQEFELQFTESSYKPLLLLVIIAILLLMLLKRRKKRKA
ncbi:MAG: hypothetical protein Q8R47_02790 [Nanoarchaeota archaeon]|nr:hypothetical protein [Nanoarchaeota archaeon]